jgi:ribosomal protein S27AE
MIPSKNVCPECGCEDVTANSFGTSEAWVCNECGCTDFASNPTEEDELLEVSKKSKLMDEEELPLGEGNLIKASRMKVAKTAKTSATKVSKAKPKGRKKK